MKLLIPCLLLVLGARVFAASDPTENPTAYNAMRVVGKHLGGDSLSRIVEISGHDGVPQPFVWKVTVKGKEGVDEFDVAGGKIAAERKLPSSPSAGLPAIHLQDLNLDSSGAFDAADTQSRKVRLRFDAVAYQLRVGESGKPVWTLDLVNGDGARVGGMRLAATDGAVITTDGQLAAGPPPGEQIQTASQTTAETTTQPTDGADNSGGFFTRAGRTLDHTNETVKRSFLKAGSRVQRFFGIHGEDQPTEPAN